MNGEVFGDDSRSKVWNDLQSRCYLPARPDNNRRYLTSLMVFGNREVEETQSPLPESFCKLMTNQNIIDPQMIMVKITNVLRVLSFREPRVLVQFWSPVTVRKRCLLTTLDQPFGLGMVDEGLYLYRLESEQRMFVVDGEHREDLGPPGRAYRQKLPEWSLDTHGLSNTQCAQDRFASYNIKGYISLPVFEPDSGCCVGVLELITSSNYVDYAFEVRQLSTALKEENLQSPNVFEDTISHVRDERRQHELDEIFLVLKQVCDIQKLPIAQTWGLSGYSSSVEYSGNLVQSCSSFNKSCIGKVCMSTTGLPFYVRDLSMWGFHEACKERHQHKSHGVVGTSLSSHGLCFCEDVSKLSEDEYPLVPYAQMNGITGCLAVYLKSLELDVEYVIELFLPPCFKNEADLQSLVKTVKQQIKNASRIQLGIMSFPQVIGGTPLDWNLESPPLTEKDVPLELELLADNRINNGDVTYSKEQNEVAYVEHMKEDNLDNEPCNSGTAGTSQNVVSYLEDGIKDFDINKGARRKNATESFDGPSKKRTRSDRPINIEEISKHFEKTMDEAADALHVSRSTLKRICRNLGIPRWPYRNGPDKSDSLKLSHQTDVAIHASEKALTTLVLGAPIESLDATNRSHDTATLTQHDKHHSAPVFHQKEQTDLPGGCAEADTPVAENSIANTAAADTLQDVMIKATYRENTVKFPFVLSDGLVKLEELIASRFQLGLGSFSLKYEDEDGDMILIACDIDIKASVDACRQLDAQTLVRLLVLPVHQSPDA
ncbi:hypothetical protein E3N88_30891 [Mikania micrantha]|uniref:PB1 domain-containing protein n=1 Tax=Mikania micrantha TaxID=192012 RepID=A0A5N6MQ49_9ASTR|nr:hypothetical protein E3N88_30891 [Mikania micrantha]